MKAGISIRVVAVLIAVFLVLPTIIVVTTSFTEARIITFPPKGFSLQWFEEILTSRRWMGALQNSLVAGLIAAAIAMVVGVSLAMAAARGTWMPRTALTMFSLLPMLVPLVVIALGVYLVFVQFGFYGNVWSFGVAHSLLGVPFVFVNVLAALTGLDPRVEEAARVSGASYPVTLIRITIPQILPSALIGGRLQRAHAGGAHRHHAPPPLARRHNARGRIGAYIVHLRMHHTVFHISRLHRAEGAQPDV
mgnify:CR=1 FL=1